MIPKPFRYGRGGVNCTGVSLGWADFFFSYEEVIAVNVYCHRKRALFVRKNPRGVTTAAHINSIIRETPCPSARLYKDLPDEIFGVICHSLTRPPDEASFLELLALVGDKDAQHTLRRPVDG